MFIEVLKEYADYHIDSHKKLLVLFYYQLQVHCMPHDGTCTLSCFYSLISYRIPEIHLQFF